MEDNFLHPLNVLTRYGWPVVITAAGFEWSPRPGYGESCSQSEDVNVMLFENEIRGATLRIAADQQGQQ